MNHKVFVSFSFKDQQIADNIVDQLERKYGIPCWICTKQIRAGSSFYKEIELAIKSSEVLLFLQTRNSVKSEEIPKEISSAIAHKKTVIRFVLEEVEDSEYQDAGVIFNLRGKQRIDAIGTDLDDIIGKLAEEIDNVLTQINAENRKERNDNEVPKTQYTLSSKIPQPREWFVGREPVLDEIKSFFEQGNRVLFLEGVGGIGKSEIAKQYAKRNLHKYNNVIFVSYTDSLFSLVCDKNEIEIKGLFMEVDENEEEFFKRKLRIFRSITDKKTLLIIDNFDVDKDERLDEFLLGTHDVLFTTRNQHPGYNSIKIGSLPTEQDVFEVFEKNYGMKISQEDRIYLEKLFKMIEYHTYAIELLAKQMRVGFYSGKELFEMYQSRAYINNEDDVVEGRHTSKTAFGHLSALFSMSSLTDDEKTVLMELAATGICGVPASSYFSWTSVSSVKPIVSGLVKKSWVRRENLDGVHKLTLHPLLIDVLRAEFNKLSSKNKVYIINISNQVRRDIRESSFSLKNNLEVIEPVMNIVDWHDPIVDCNDSIVFNAWMEIALFLLNRSVPKYELKILKQLNKYAITNAQKFYCHEKTIQCYIKLGTPEKAIELLNLYDGLLDTDSELCDFDTGKKCLILLNRCVEVYRDLGNYSKAERYFSKAQTFYRFYEYYEGDLWGWSQYHIGRSRIMEGDLIGGEETIMSAVEIFEKNDDEHSSAYCYDLLAFLFFKRGDCSTALDFSKKAYELLASILGENHIDIARNFKIRGDIFKKIGDGKEAKENYDAAGRIYSNYPYIIAKAYI